MSLITRDMLCNYKSLKLEYRPHNTLQLAIAQEMFYCMYQEGGKYISIKFVNSFTKHIIFLCVMSFHRINTFYSFWISRSFMSHKMQWFVERLFATIFLPQTRQLFTNSVVSKYFGT